LFTSDGCATIPSEQNHRRSAPSQNPSAILFLPSFFLYAVGRAPASGRRASAAADRARQWSGSRRWWRHCEAPRRRTRPPMGGCITAEWLLDGALRRARAPATTSWDWLLPLSAKARVRLLPARRIHDRRRCCPTSRVTKRMMAAAWPSTRTKAVVTTLGPCALMAMSGGNHSFYPHASPLQRPEHARRRPNSARWCLRSPFSDSLSTAMADSVDGGGVSPLNPRVRVSILFTLDKKLHLFLPSAWN
jgi:hypothetical protein